MSITANPVVMAGTAMEVIKKWIGHGSEEMIRRYTHLASVPDFPPEFASNIAVTLLTQNSEPWHDVNPVFATAGRSSNW
jgi:hypothetical protein